MTPVLEEHLADMQSKAGFIEAMAEALSLAVSRPATRALVFELIDMIGRQANGVGTGLDAVTLAKVEASAAREDSCYRSKAPIDR